MDQYFKIKWSIGGTAEVIVSLSIELKIGIFPGVGAAKMELDDTYNHLTQVHGIPDSHLIFEFYYPADGHYEYWHNMYYNSIKAIFVVFSYSSTYYENDSIINISVEYPYNGLTDKLIGIGSSLNEVKIAYGEPPEIITSYSHYFQYESIGIRFYYDEGDTLVTKIQVYHPG